MFFLGLTTNHAGVDPLDATSSKRPTEDFAAGLLPLESLPTKPLSGKRIGVIKETMGEGVDEGVQDVIKAALVQLTALGAKVKEVCLPSAAACDSNTRQPSILLPSMCFFLTLSEPQPQSHQA